MKIRIIITLLSLFVVSHELVFGQDLQLTITNVTCNGLCNGVINLNLISTQNCGNGPYQYQIIGPSPSVTTTTSPVTSATTYSFTNLCVGTYTIRVLVNGNECYSTPQPIIGPSALTSNVAVTQPQCNQLNSVGNNYLGSAILTVSGGSTGGCFNGCRGYNVYWTGPGGISGGSAALNACPKEIVFAPNCAPPELNTYVMNGLAPGTYNISIEDNNNCPTATSFTILQPTPITVSGLLANNSIDITITGGTPGYTYLWSNGATTQDVTNLSSGTYTVTVTDANNCTASASYAVQNQNPVLSVNSIISPVLCFGGQDGSINVTVAGGNAPYNVSWSGPVSGNPAGNEIVYSGGSYLIANLPAGIYSLTVTDANGTSDIIQLVINQPTPIATSLNIGSVSCNGGNDGWINLVLSGGTPPYMIQWSNGSNSQNLSNLSAGVYNFIITDANNCNMQGSINITQPLPITIASVIGANSIDITVSGGTAPYVYSWSNGATTQDITNLSSGPYAVTVTDANNCTVSAIYTVQNQNPPLAISGTPTNSCCAGAAQGSILVVATGGNPPYNVSLTGPVNWNPAGNEILASGGSYVIASLMAGSYTVLVTDASGNSQAVVVTITEPLPLAAASVQSNTLCSGTCTGSINLTVTGGVAPYVYSWTGIPFYSSSNEDLSNLCPGVYTVSVTDACGCINTLTQVITAPPAFTLTGMITQIPCGGGNNGAIDVTVGGGTPGYTYVWTGPSGYTANTQDLLNLAAGTYTLTATDANNCTITQNWLVNPAPQSLQLSETNVDVLCSGQATGSIDLTTVGGTAPYAYMWGGPGAYTANTQDITGLAAGNYSVTVMDANNCTMSLSNIEITASPNLVLTGSVNGNNIDISVSGGTVPYNYSWSNGAVTQDLPNVLPGTYVVIVTDAFNCSISDTFTVDNAGLEQQQSIELQVFPNPAQDVVTLLSSSAGIGNTYRILDCYGRNVAEGKLQTAETTFSIQALANGVYHVKCGSVTRALVISH